MSEGVGKTTSPSEQDRVWGILSHLSALALFIIPPIGHIAGPLVVWLVKKNDIPFVNEEGKKSLNFQISMTVYLGAALLMRSFLIGIPLLVLLVLADVVLVVLAAMTIKDHKAFQYPCAIRFIK